MVSLFLYLENSPKVYIENTLKHENGNFDNHLDNIVAVLKWLRDSILNQTQENNHGAKSRYIYLGF